MNGGASRPHQGTGGTAMVQVRESSRFGLCYALGELIGETATRYIYRNRAGIAFVSKSSSIHLAPCQVCATMSRATRRLRTPAQARRGRGRVGANARQQNRAHCDWHHRPHRPKRTHSPDSPGEMDMLEQLAFTLVAVALAAPFLVSVLWSQLGQSSQDRQPSHKTSGRSA